MSSRRRNSKKNLGTNLSDIQRRLRRMERKPIRTRLQNRVIKGAAIAPSSITADEVEFGTNLVSTETPEDFIINPKDGQEVTNPDTGGKKVYNEESGEWVEVKDPVAQASADGKNNIYRQDYEPTGGTYALGDTWFDTDDSNKIHRYSTAITATVTNKSLTSNIATLTVSEAHTFVVGETITVSGVDATFNGSYEVSATPTALTVRYAKTATNVAFTSATGTITNTAGWKGFALGDGALINISAAKITAGSLAAGVIVTSAIDAGQITTGTLTGVIINLAGNNSYGQFTLTNTLKFGSPSLTWGPTATPSFEIYQSGGGSGTVINADGNSGDGYLFIDAGVRIELQAPEVFFFYTPTAPSGTSSTNIGSKQAYRNIYATSTAGTPTGGQDGDIVVVYTP